MTARHLTYILILAAALCVGACSRTVVPTEPPAAWVTPQQDTRLARFAPVIARPLLDNDYDYLGGVSARTGEDGVELFVDPGIPTIYATERTFETEKAQYTNLVYRIHFPRIPWPHLTMGRNVGHLVIITLNAEEQPVLVSVAHTCGCYYHSMATNYLPRDAWPERWNYTERDVYGHMLPRVVHYPEPLDTDWRTVVVIASNEHRIEDVRVEPAGALAWRYRVIDTALADMDTLWEVPIAGTNDTIPFFYQTGRREGYVRGSKKPLEKIFMGWWAFDFWVGRDKSYGYPERVDTTFYTSLKVWNRTESDMEDFAQLLDFWGWDL